MPTFVYMTRCDGCGHCVDICPSVLGVLRLRKGLPAIRNRLPRLC